MPIHKFSGGELEIVEGFVMRITFLKDHDVTVQDIQELTGIRKKTLGERTYCSLIDVRKDFLTFTTEAKKFITQNPLVNSHRVVEAILVKNFGQKLGAEMFMTLFKPKRKTKVFYDEEKAIAWLRVKYQEYLEANPE